MYLRHLFLFFILFCSLLNTSFAQHNDNIPIFLNWEDDVHFIISEETKNGEFQQFKVNAKTNKKVIFNKKKETNIRQLLPDKYKVTSRNAVLSTKKDKIIIIKKGDLYFFSKENKEIITLTRTPAVTENNPRFSPDEKFVSFTQKGNLFVVEISTQEIIQLTFDGSNTIYNGFASWIYYEEILGRSSNYAAYWWAPDSKQIAFLSFDDSPVPKFPIYRSAGTHGELEFMHYPKSGDPNPKVKLGIANIKTKKTNWLNQDHDIEKYTAWPFWTPDSKHILFQQLNRDQNSIQIICTNIQTFESKIIYQEDRPTWVEFFKDIIFLKNTKGFILRSNKDGWYNLYHYDLQGNLIHQITSVDWRISAIVSIDEKNKKIFFYGTGGINTEQHFFSINFDGTNFKQLTHENGMHYVDLSPNANFFIDTYSNIHLPKKVNLKNNNGKILQSIGVNKIDLNKENNIKVELIMIPSDDGFMLPAKLIFPTNMNTTEKHPVIFSIYGGPNAEGVYNTYQNFNYDPLLEKGIILIVVDHRGSGKFGKKGLDYMHRNLGKWEIHDYVAVVKWLQKKDYVDSDKIGITGSSYGGYLSALALMIAPQYFTHGIAKLSVTDWKLYNSAYTERYMDKPADNNEGYIYGSVMTHAENLKGKLLIVHGTMDDNVHLQNSIQLISKLQDFEKDFEMMFYPEERHGWGGAKGRHLNKLSLAFWEKHFFNSKTQ